MTAHDDLRRQLTDSVAARATAATPAPRRGGGRRWRGSHRGLAVVVLAVALGGGVAGAATQLLSGREPGDGATARQLVERAVITSSRAAACRRATGRFVSGSALAEVERVFPPRTAPIPLAVRKAVLRYAAGAILTSSVRLVRFPAGERLLVYATLGSSPFIRTNPDACDRAQRARLVALHPEDDAIRRRALAILATEQERPSARQTLTIFALGRRGSAGTAIPVRPGRPLPTGVLFGGGPSSAAVHGGIAVAGATTVTLTTGPHAKHAVRRTLAVRERLFAFTLPRGTGPVTLHQRAADGATLAMQHIRR